MKVLLVYDISGNIFKSGSSDEAAGNNDTQQQFHNILMRLRNGELSVEDWKHLIK